MFKYKLIHREELERINQEKSDLQTQVSLLEKKIESLKPNVLDVGIGDPQFKSGDERIAYISRVAGFYEDVLKNKLESMIEEIHQMMELDSNTERLDLTLKGTAYALRELLLWGDEYTREYKGFLATKPKENGSKSPEEQLASLLV
jgi:hypothetical protein